MCSQCEALTINGVYCHETGCPLAPKTCKTFGKQFTEGSENNSDFCSDDCNYDYNAEQLD